MGILIWTSMWSRRYSDRYWPCLAVLFYE
jgi:hypothetical protein